MASILEVAKGFTTTNAKLIVEDAGYLPAERFDFCPMGCSKTAKAILAEVARTNAAIAAALRGQDPKEVAADFAAKVDAASNIDELGKLVIESGKIVCDTLDTLSEADLDREIGVPWGVKLPFSIAIFLPANHMYYHDGQVNYIQTLLGDAKFHWAEK
jgi:uncharacterized damage-inducible protein DinB